MGATGGTKGSPSGETGPPAGLIPIPDINDPDVSIDDVAMAYHLNMLQTGQSSTLAEWKAWLTYQEAVESGGGSVSDADYARFGLGNVPESLRIEISRTIDQKIQRDREISRNARLYVDVPTADEFLDDFEVGFNMFLTQLGEQGGIGRQLQGFAGDMAQDFFQMYMAELGSRAAAGEDIFRVVGVNAEEERIGSRTGEVTEETVKEDMRAEEKVAQEQRTTAEGGELGEPGQETSSVSETTTGQEVTREGSETTEEIFKRSRLAVIHDLSPSAFMMQRFKTPEALETFVASTRGRRAAREELNRRGAPVSAGRRV